MKLSKLRLRYVILLFVLLLGNTFPLPCAATQSQTSFTITAVIPESYMLHLDIEGPGAVTVDGRRYTEDAVIPLPRHAQPLIQAESDFLCEIGVLKLDGEILAQDQSGHIFYLGPVTRDVTLQSAFRTIPAALPTAAIVSGCAAIGTIASAAMLTGESGSATVAGQSIVQHVLAGFKRRKKP